MSENDEMVVRRFYEEMCNGRHNEIAAQLFAADHVMHDPQVPAEPGPTGMAAAVATFQESVEGHWQIEEMTSAGERVCVRWTGTGRHVADFNGIPASGRTVRVDGISVHRMRDGKIAETHEVWDTLSFLRQLGAVPGELTERLRDGYGRFASGDIPGVLAMFDPGIRWSVPETIRLGGTYAGPAAVGGFFARLPELYAEFVVHDDQYVEAGDTVTVLGHHTGRTVGGQQFDMPFVHVWRLRDGRVVAFTEFLDTARMNAILAGSDVAVPSQVSRAAERTAQQA